MLKAIIVWCNAVLVRETRLVDRAYGVCFLIGVGDRKAPAQFSRGDMVPVEPDKHNVVAWWRKVGAGGISQRNAEHRAGEIIITQEHQLRLVLSVPSDRFPYNDANNADRAADNVLKILSGYNTQLKDIIGARSVLLTINSVETRRDEVIASELPEQTVNLRNTLLFLDVTAMVDIMPSCLKTVNESSHLGDFDILDFSAKDFDINYNK